MQRRKNRRSRKSVAPLHKSVRRSAIELLESKHLLTSFGYLQVPLAADQAGAALLQDPNLQNAWGVSISPGGGPVWVADNAANVASRYSGAVTGSSFTSAASVGVPDNSPTAIVFNQTTDFTVGTGSNAFTPIFFIASANGKIDAWSTGNQAQNAVSVSGAEFTGLAVANNGTASFLYAADFHNGQIDVFDSHFNQTTLSATAFTDTALTAQGFAPYNIQLIGGQLYVTYAKQDASKQNPVPATGNGAIDVFSLNGTLVKQLVSGSELNVPYGLAVAPASFGDAAGDLLVANSGSGQILAYNISGATATFAGTLNSANSTPINIPGVRGLVFGNDSSAGNDTTLFYSAASGGHGQFGELLNAFQQPLVVVPTNVSANQGQAFSGTLAAVSDSNSSLTAGSFTVTINWGDNLTSSGSVTSNTDGGFNISGTHTYATVGNKKVTITVSDSTTSIVATGTATVTDTSFNPSGTSFAATEGQSFNGLVGSFADPSGPGSYVANINWGDGTSSSATTVSSGLSGGFNVTGTHTYTSVGSFSVSAVISEVSGTTTTAIGTIDSTATVSDPNTLTATAGAFTATQGLSTTATVATFTDSNSAATASLFSATINWGDGTTASAGSVTRGGDGVFTVSGSHAYVENGTLTATVTVSDTPGTATATTTSVADVADGNTFTPHPMTIASNAGQTFAGNVATFSDTNTLVRAADFTATINWGDSTTSTGTITAANGVLTVSGSHSYTSGGTLEPVSVIITENSPGTANATATSTAVVAAGNFTATGATITATASSASSPQTLASFTPDAADQSDTFTATIDWGDGTSFTVGTVTSSGGSSFNVVGSHIYSTPGNYSPQVVVYEASGTATATPAEVITAKANVTSPVVLSPATITAKDHVSSTLTVATFTDADASVTATDFTATINWGDGTSASLGTVTLNNGVFTVAGIHTFAEAGTLDVSVTVTQDAPTVFSTSATATATVSQDDGFTASAASLSATVGSAFSGVLATFTDTDLQTTASQLTAVIHWGDGSDTAGTVTGSSGQFAVHGSHTYTQDGSFPLSVTIENSSSLPGFTEAVATGSAMVSPGSAFTATGTTITPSEGQTFSGTVATFTDTGSSNPQSAFTATIKWGDGSTTSGTVTGSSGSYTVSGSHAYSDGGSYQMTVQVVETAISDTISAVSTATVSGSDTLTASNSTFTATAGTSFTGAVAGFTDSNTAAVAGDFTATISWGDGSTSTTGTVTGSNGVFTITGQHLYSTAATDTVKVTIKDVHLSSVSATATSTADVLAATGTGATTGTISGLVFDDLNLNGVFEAGDPGLAGRTVFLNVDGSGKADGTNPQATTDANGNFTFTGLQPGTYQVMEVISANGGQTLTTSPQTVTLTTGQTVTGVNIGNLVTSKIVPLPVTTSGPQAASDVNTAYINALYQSILGHAPDATGLAFWQQQMAAGASRATVAQGIWDSPEHRKQEVDGFYQEFLNRAPDAQGEQFWINAFNSWGTEQLEVVGFLTATSEYASLHPGNTAFVDALYNDIDQRPADSAGEANWVTQLGNGATPVQVALDFVFGQEASTHIVNGFYSAFLHRAPDAASLQMWVNDLDAQTMTAEQVAIQLLASNEYFTRVTASQAPAITSAASTTFTAGTASTFHVTTSGVPAPSITATGLPSGVTLTDNHDGTATLASTTAAAANTYTFTITASNGIGTAATQNFTLTISPAQTQSAPAFTSANSSVFTAGSAGSFSITSSGSPAATITENGTLPSGLTFTPGTGGTATITGTPAANTGGTYTIALTASNGVGTAATQSLLLIVNQAPSITSTASTSFVAGTVGTFKVQTAGFPVTSISATGLPNAGLTLVDNHDGTATLTSTTGLAAGSYPLTINATNNIGTPASQSFTLTVAAASAAPAFTSATSTTFTTGTASTFSVTTTGSPSATLTESGTLPTGVTFVDHGGGQGTLSGTAAANTGGTYNFTITADNGNGTPVAQNFTLTVHQAPAFTSAASATFVAGTAGTFKVQTSGFPTASVSGTGLPANLTLTPNSDGTATLTSGTSLAAGTYPFTLQAANGVGTQVTQSFTLTVAAAASAPAFTSAGNATFTVGTAGTFSVTTSGAPSAALTESGTLPAGVTFVDNGGGRGTLSGTPAAGTGGTYSFTLTANNGNGTPGTQTFVLTVDQAPAITSANATTFVAGASGTFTVHTAGFPNATINVTGLPSGVTRTDNGNGTATITSTTGAAAGTYSLTITATNGVGTTATQSFTLTIGSTQTAPAFTSATSATFVAGTGGTFSVTTTGTPSAALSLSGQPQGVTLVDNGGGQGKLTVASSTAAGVYNLTFSATNGVGNPITQSFTLTVNAPLSFTSASSASFVSGTGGTFTVSATGTPTATITETGTPPTGVSLGTSSNGSATLTVGSTTPAGVYTLTFSASNGVGNPVTQSFTLTVGTAPSFSSATSVSFVAGTGGTFTVSASGTPTASITETDTPPTGVSLGTSSNGSATLTVGSTTPAGVYHLTFSATNGVGNPVTQSFTLTVGTAPAFTGATSATFAPGAGGTATISTTGSPNATVSEDPNDTPITGVTLTPNADGTATLTVGTSTPAGVYTLNLIASNGVGTAATEQFKLTVGTAPAFTGATSATFAPGAGGTATISTTGSPNATVSEDPNDTPISGVTLTPNADGTATLTVGTSTPAGVHTLNLIATNGVGTAATEQFTLTVGTAPAFSSNSGTSFAAGTGGTFTITTTGSPTPTISEDPNDTPVTGVSLTPNGDGTATLTVDASTPAGVYTLNLIASNNVGTAATQQFTLTIS
ncbi:MAG TPA: TIGR03118 family protein [Pirellulales bacterium]|nr:TIGR03118 family protein [Pirellulales bacterium]